MKTKTTSLSDSLLSALEFVSRTQLKRSTVPAYSHCRLFAKHLSACGPVLCASVGIQEDIECCPHTRKLLDALKQCDENLNLTMLPTGELSVKSGNFQVAIPCIDPPEIGAIYADGAQLQVDPSFEQALNKVGTISDEHSKLILYSSVVLREISVIATDGDIILEAMHNSRTPHPLILPKLFISALRKTRDKSLCSIGWSVDSFTGWFPDGSWIKTKLQAYADMPDLERMLQLPANFVPAPHGLWAAVKQLAPFSKDKIYFRANGISSDDGAIILCSGLPDGLSFPVNALMTIEPFAEHLAFSVTDKMTYFRGDKVRGAIAQQQEK